MLGTTKINESLNVTRLPSAPQRDCDPFLDSVLAKVIKTIAYAILLIAIGTGNSLVIATYYRNRKLRTSVDLYILNMAMSDLLTAAFALPMQIQHIYLQQGLWVMDGLFGSITCKFIPFASDISLIVSVLTLEVIAVERFFAVVLTKKRPNHSKKTCFIIIAIIWFIGALYPSINFFKFRIVHYKEEVYCARSWEPAFDDAEAFKVEGPLLLVCFTMLPFVILTSLYSAIVIFLHRQKGHLYLASAARKRKLKRYRKITYMLVAVVIVFLVSWMPFNIYWFLRAFVWSSLRPCDSRHLIFIANFLIHIYPAINPFVYYIFNEDYKKGFRELLCCFRRYETCCANQRSPKTNQYRIPYTVEPGSTKAVVTLISTRPREENQ